MQEEVDHRGLANVAALFVLEHLGWHRESSSAREVTDKGLGLLAQWAELFTAIAFTGVVRQALKLEL